jgi:hypothetical protein
MNAAAPDGAPQRRIGDRKFKKISCPPWFGEALRRKLFIYTTIFMVRVRTESSHVCFSRAKTSVIFPDSTGNIFYYPFHSWYRNSYDN